MEASVTEDGRLLIEQQEFPLPSATDTALGLAQLRIPKASISNFALSQTATLAFDKSFVKTGDRPDAGR